MERALVAMHERELDIAECTIYRLVSCAGVLGSVAAVYPLREAGMEVGGI